MFPTASAWTVAPRRTSGARTATDGIAPVATPTARSLLNVTARPHPLLPNEGEPDHAGDHWREAEDEMGEDHDD